MGKGRLCPSESKQHVAEHCVSSPPWGDGSGVPPRQALCEGWDGGAAGTVRTLGFRGGESKTALPVFMWPQLQGTAAVGGTCGTPEDGGCV